MAPLDEQLLLASDLASETTPTFAEPTAEKQRPPYASPTAPSPKMAAAVPSEAAEQCHPHLTCYAAPSADAEDARRDHPHRCSPHATWHSLRDLEKPSLSFNLGCWKNRSSLTEPTWLSTTTTTTTTTTLWNWLGAFGGKRWRDTTSVGWEPLAPSTYVRT